MAKKAKIKKVSKKSKRSSKIKGNVRIHRLLKALQEVDAALDEKIAHIEKTELELKRTKVKIDDLNTAIEEAHKKLLEQTHPPHKRGSRRKLH
jgi:peptidoglycan hydrolase CwlO-like protein